MSVYNGMPFLEASVRSILGQREPDLELLVVDDGSTDAGPDLLREQSARDSRMRVLYRDENHGVAQSRNLALHLAQGEYIACQDADDISLDDRLAHQARCLDQNPLLGMVGTQVVFIGDDGEPIEGSRSRFPEKDSDIQIRLLESNCFCAGSVMMRREALERAGYYDQTMAPSEDYDLWLRLSEVAQMGNLADVLYLYRQHSGSASSQNRWLQMHRKALALQRAMVRRHGERLPFAVREAIARDFLRAACLGAASGEIEGGKLSTTLALGELDDARRSASLVEGIVLRYALGLWGEQASRNCETLFQEVFPRRLPFSEVERRVRSRLSVEWLFGRPARGRGADVDRRLWHAVRDDPRWLLNRAFWSVGLRNLSAVLRRTNRVTPED